MSRSHRSGGIGDGLGCLLALMIAAIVYLWLKWAALTGGRP